MISTSIGAKIMAAGRHGDTIAVSEQRCLSGLSRYAHTQVL